MNSFLLFACEIKTERRMLIMRKCKMKRKALRSILNKQRKKNKNKARKATVGLDKSSMVNNVLSLLDKMRNERK